jgi:hypothetical protein
VHPIHYGAVILSTNGKGYERPYPYVETSAKREGNADMTHIAYTLSMPNVGSWNGKWTGAAKVYIRVRTYSDKDARVIRVLGRKYPSAYYDFGDGWGASIAIEKVDGKEKIKRNKRSAGFCGYEWMIDSLEEFGDIRIKERTT